MKKSLVALSAIAALSTSSFASNITQEDMVKQIEALKTQIEMLEAKINQSSTETPVTDERFKKLEKKVESNKNLALQGKRLAANDNIKWDIDFRTQVDNITYKRNGLPDAKNNALLTNRLLLGMAYAPNDNTIFQGKLSYNKAFGDTANHSQSNTNPGFADFDWVTNENATDNTVKVKEAYWLYKENDALVPWTVSIGRRPSTDGLPINLRNNQTANSPLSHVVDVEFDGFSAKFDLEELIGSTGSWFKICGGRGLTNATPRFDFFEPAYAEDETKNVDVDMLGFIAVPYDDGQYSVHINYARAWNLIGYDGDSLSNFMGAYNGYQDAYEAYMTAMQGSDQVAIQEAFSALNDAAFGTMAAAPQFKDVGDIDYATALFKVYGIGNEISDYLDDTTFFASYAMSRTRPNEGQVMLGSPDSETGHSYWVGINAPCPISPDDARIGVEWNKGSKYWRSMTYGEDTYAGSKIAARGTAFEVYRNSKINDALSWGMSYTKIDYDYTGSNSFFGADGEPLDVNLVSGAVTEAQDIKAYVRYRF